MNMMFGTKKVAKPTPAKPAPTKPAAKSTPAKKPTPPKPTPVKKAAPVKKSAPAPAPVKKAASGDFAYGLVGSDVEAPQFDPFKLSVGRPAETVYWYRAAELKVFYVC
jgi:hypothetical protein